MKHVIVSKKVTDGMGAGMDSTNTNRTPGNLNSLTEGTITLGRTYNNLHMKYTSATTILESGTAIQDNENVYFVQKMKDGNIYTSPLINPRTLNWHKETFNANNAKKIDLGYTSDNTSNDWNLPTPSDHVGDYIIIKIYNLEAAVGITNNVKDVHYQIKEGDTVDSIHTEIETRLKNYEGTFFSSVNKEHSGGAYGYKFTGKTDKNFTVVCEGILKDADVVNQTDLKASVGEGADILALEKEGAVRYGYNPSEETHSNQYTQDFMTDTSVDYDVFVLRWSMDDYRQVTGDVNMNQELVIATPVNGGSASAQKISDQVQDVLEALADSSKSWDA